jgi:hypothetical protein
MKLRAVIFDYGNVICRPPTEQQLSEAAALCGLTVEEFVQAFWRKRREYDRGTDARAYWQDIAESHGRVFDEALIGEMMRREVDFWGRCGLAFFLIFRGRWGRGCVARRAFWSTSIKSLSPTSWVLLSPRLRFIGTRLKGSGWIRRTRCSWTIVRKTWRGRGRWGFTLRFSTRGKNFWSGIVCGMVCRVRKRVELLVMTHGDFLRVGLVRLEKRDGD